MLDRRRAVAFLVAGALLGTACSSDDGAEVVTAEVVTAEVVQTVAAPARLEPRDRRTVAAPAPAEVAELFVDDGKQVTAGDPIVRLESGSVDLAVVQAGAAVEAAGSFTGLSLAPDLSPIVSSVRTQLESTIGPLIAELSRQANAVQDPALRERALAVLSRVVVNYEQTRQGLLDTERQARAASSSSSAAQRRAAEAQRQQAELALEAAQDQEDGLTLVAPIDGVVEFGSGPAAPGGLGESGLDGLLGGGSGAGPLAVGAQVAPGQGLFTVYDIGGFHALATVDEIDVVLVAEGQRATVLIDAFADLEIPGFVSRVALAPDRTGTGGVVYPVQVELTRLPSDVQLRVGLTASVEIVVERVDGDRVVPSAALRRRDGREVVLAVRDGVVRVVPVEVIAIGEDTAAVEGDLDPDDVVVVSGADGLDDGDELP